jgi:hypothetical protein
LPIHIFSANAFSVRLFNGNARNECKAFIVMCKKTNRFMEQEEGDFVHSRILLAGKNGEKNLP